jgi:hypothetical protein
MQFTFAQELVHLILIMKISLPHKPVALVTGIGIMQPALILTEVVLEPHLYLVQMAGTCV